MNMASASSPWRMISTPSPVGGGAPNVFKTRGAGRARSANDLVGGGKVRQSKDHWAKDQGIMGQ